MSIDLTAIRSEYALAGLSERDAEPSPLDHVSRWLREAITAKHPEPTAMTLALVDPDGMPSARVVLLKGIDAGLVFFTNYESDKGRAIDANAHASACLFWNMLERQVRVRGTIEKTSRAESERYFASRPRESQLGAWASRQSDVIANRDVLERRLAEAAARYPSEVPCPPHWGGYRLLPRDVELWQGRPSRLHDRLRYVQAGAAWKIERLSP